MRGRSSADYAQRARPIRCVVDVGEGHHNYVAREPHSGRTAGPQGAGGRARGIRDNHAHGRTLVHRARQGHPRASRAEPRGGSVSPGARRSGSFTAGSHPRDRGMRSQGGVSTRRPPLQVDRLVMEAQRDLGESCKRGPVICGGVAPASGCCTTFARRSSARDATAPDETPTHEETRSSVRRDASRGDSLRGQLERSARRQNATESCT